MKRRWSLWWAVLSWSSWGALAATYYADPARGVMTNPGNPDQPWGSLAEVLAAGKAFASGDVIVLRSGHHGSPTIRGVHEADVLIEVEAGARATVQRLSFRGARHWRVRGLEVSPEVAGAGEFERTTLVRLWPDASRITVENCRLQTVRDASQWTAADWDQKACDGFLVSGANNVVRSNVLLNVNFGISVSGASNLVEFNEVENFSGDGLRGLGDYSTFQYNTVKNCYAVNRNHDDGFQSWSVGPGGVGTGVVRGVVLRGNRIVNYEDPNQPHRGYLQGIGCFDGFFEDWLIENNVILTDHWHGLTLAGARNCRILNNTVIDLNNSEPGPAWIRIGNHKNGQRSSGNIVRNNLATGYSIEPGAASLDHNEKISDRARYFVNPGALDVRLRSGSPAVDAGSNEGVPGIDVNGHLRPADGDGDGRAEWDLGAYEMEASAPVRDR